MNRNIVTHFPVAATLLAEFGSFAQIFRMVQQGSADDQSLIGWVVIAVALLMWYVWWITFQPNENWPRYCAAFGMWVKVLGAILIVYLRWG